MNKVFSKLKGSMDGWVSEEKSEDFVIDDFKNLGEDDTRDWFSYNPKTVKISDQDKKFDVKFYDPSKAEDKAILDSVKNKLPYLRQDLQDIKSKLFVDLDFFDLLTGVASGDKYIMGKISDLKKEYDDYLKNMGF